MHFAKCPITVTEDCLNEAVILEVFSWSLVNCFGAGDGRMLRPSGHSCRQVFYGKSKLSLGRTQHRLVAGTVQAGRGQELARTRRNLPQPALMRIVQISRAAKELAEASSRSAAANRLVRRSFRRRISDFKYAEVPISKQQSGNRRSAVPA